ncbi:HAD family hydrolase [Candidatus Bathyarchaeota archaeon]|nr:HAD family hydrolase [Candidatus Bathyarchaeota archaeon]
MPSTKAIVFDFIGTLTDVEDYSMDESKMKLHKALVKVGFNTEPESFDAAYSHAHEKYRAIRYQELTEVTNAVWISEALTSLGFKTSPEDARIKTALNVFFKDFIESFRLRPYAHELLQKASEKHSVGLVSNFTYSPVIYAGLRRLRINKFFNAVLVSEEVGWRKPHAKIFQEALKRLNATTQTTLYVGDSPLEDIKGANALGIKTVFVPSQFYTLEFLHECKQKPDHITKDLCELYRRFEEILECR